MKNKFAIIVVLILFFSFASTIVKADIGPKPSADIHLTLDGQNITDPVFKAKMFTCHYQMKYEEMSEILGTSVGALKASYHHAVKKIETMLEED